MTEEDSMLVTDFVEFVNSTMQNESLANEIPSISCIYKNNRRLADSVNRVEEIESKIFHSEIIAISKACSLEKSKILQDCILLTTLEPCIMCAGAIMHSRIVKVVYFAEHQKGTGISSISNAEIYKNNFFPKLVFTKNKEIESLFKNFFLDKR
jgi:cytosine deaminase/tRNA(adenine34) deaminase